MLKLLFLYFFKIDFLYLQIFNVVFYFYATLLYFNEHENIEHADICEAISYRSLEDKYW